MAISGRTLWHFCSTLRLPDEPDMHKARSQTANWVKTFTQCTSISRHFFHILRANHEIRRAAQTICGAAYAYGVTLKSWGLSYWFWSRFQSKIYEFCNFSTWVTAQVASLRPLCVWAHAVESYQKEVSWWLAFELLCFLAAKSSLSYIFYNSLSLNGLWSTLHMKPNFPQSVKAGWS